MKWLSGLGLIGVETQNASSVRLFDTLNAFTSSCKNGLIPKNLDFFGVYKLAVERNNAALLGQCKALLRLVGNEEIMARLELKNEYLTRTSRINRRARRAAIKNQQNGG